MSRNRIGIDIGGSGIKAGLVDVAKGVVISERLRIETPQPSTPHAVARATGDLVRELDGGDVVGIGFPSIIRDGVVMTANNIDEAWIGGNAVELFEEAIGSEVRLINDADAAALAEAEFGSAKGIPGTVVVITFGTGIGSGVLLDGKLLRNVELGMLEFGGVYPAEAKYSAKARRREDLDWDEWGGRINDFIRHVDRIFSPTRIVVGGGVSRHWEEFSHTIDADLPVVRANLANDAGLIGAAVLAT